MTLSRRTVLLASAAAVAAPSLKAQTTGWPSKTVRIVVPYPPGGSSDIIARSISQPLSDALKQTVIVENRAGANGNLGADFVARSAPDGYTLLLCDTGALAISPSVYTQAVVRSVEGPARRDHAGVLAAPAGGESRHPGEQPEGTGGAVENAQPEFRRVLGRRRAAPGRRGRRARQRREMAIRAVQGRLAGHPGHDRRADRSDDERHAGHLPARAERQAEGAGRVQAHAHAADRRRAHHRRAGRARLRVRHLAGDAWWPTARPRRSSRA